MVSKNHANQERKKEKVICLSTWPRGGAKRVCTQLLEEKLSFHFRQSLLFLQVMVQVTSSAVLHHQVRLVSGPLEHSQKEKKTSE